MKELTPEVKQALLAPFQSAEVRVRTQPYVAAYVTARVVMTRLDEVIPWQWSFRLVGSGSVDQNGVMHQDGILLIQHPDGRVSEFHDRGSAPPDLGKGQAKQAKHAVSDCFKRCAVHSGVGRYLYELQNVQGGRIPKASLEKALAAVGYAGAWDDRHHGILGGIREADMEDEPEDARPTPSPSSGKVETSLGKTEAPPAGRNAANGHAAEPSPNGKSKATLTPDAPAEADEPPVKGIEKLPSRTPSAITLSDEQKDTLIAAVEMGGGAVTSPTFLGWLSKNTANHAAFLDDVLSEDVDNLLDLLEGLAARRRASR